MKPTRLEKNSSSKFGRWSENDAPRLENAPKIIKRAVTNHTVVKFTIMKKKLGSSILGRDVDHKDRNPRNNSKGNLRLQSKSSNRSRNQ